MFISKFKQYFYKAFPLSLGIALSSTLIMSTNNLYAKSQKTAIIEDSEDNFIEITPSESTDILKVPQPSANDVSDIPTDYSLDLKVQFKKDKFLEKYFNKIVNTEEKNIEANIKSYKSLVQYLNRKDKLFLFDTMNDKILKKYDNDKGIRLRIVIAQNYLETDHSGNTIDGIFLRSTWFDNEVLRSKAKRTYCIEEDRSRALKILLPLVNRKNMVGENYHNVLYNALILNRRHNHHKLYSLSSLDSKKVITKVNNNKNIFFSVPKSFDDAKNDGERIQSLVALALKKHYSEILVNYADNISYKYGINLLMNFKYSDEVLKLANSYAFAKLKDNETMLVTNIGGKKVSLKTLILPENYDYIKILKDLATDASLKKVQKLKNREQICNTLGNILQRRQRYNEAAKYFTRAKTKYANNKAKQILSPLGKFQRTETFVIGEKPSVSLEYRNAQNIKFTVYDISGSQFKKANIRNIVDHSLEYAKKIAEFHKTTTITAEDKLYHNNKKITIPLENCLDNATAGRYLVEAKLDNKNKYYIPVKINDLAVNVNKVGDSGLIISVTNPLTGKFIRNFSGTITSNRNSKIITNFSTDNGFVTVANLNHSNYLDIKIKVSNKQASLSDIYNYNNNQSSKKYYNYIITDRAVYKPGDTVFFKVINTFKNKSDNVLKIAKGLKQNIFIFAPKSKKLKEVNYITDNHGSYSGSFTIPKDGKLGRYSLIANNSSLNVFVEEYRKPEYEVEIVKPASLIAPNTAFTFTIKGKFYSGQPLNNGKVKYRVTRSVYNELWYPYNPWNWLYGDGFLYRGYALSKYPVTLTLPNPRELYDYNRTIVAGEGKLDNKGELIVNVPFVPNGQKSKKKQYINYVYNISAELKDSSQRMVRTSSTVKAFAKPFQAKSWTNKNIFFTKDTVKVITQINDVANNNTKLNFSGELKISKLNNKDKFIEQKTLPVKITNSNKLENNFSLNDAGVYRFEFKLTNDKNNGNSSVDTNVTSSIIAYVLESTANNSDKNNYIFDDLSLFSEKTTYTIGETAKIIIASDRKKLTEVIIFDTENILETKIVKLTNGIGVYNHKITTLNQPQTKLYAVGYNSKSVRFITKELTLFVPPVKKVLDVNIAVKEKIAKPGSENVITVNLTDKFGEKVTGNVVVAVYDASLDAIAQQHQDPIYKYFYGNYYGKYIQNYNNISENFYNIQSRNTLQMQQINRWKYNGYREVYGGKMEYLEENSIDSDRVYPSMSLKQSKSFARDIRGGKKESMASSMWKNTKPVPPSNPINLDSVKVRTNFADTVLWKDKLTTDKNGQAVIKFTVPEDLTRWKVKVWAINDKVQVGYNETTFATAKNFVTRGILPKFLVEGDTADLALIVQNFSKESGAVISEVSIDGDALELINKESKTKKATIKADGSLTQYWQVKAVKNGDVKITFKAATKFDKDGVILTLPITVYGTDKMVAFSGALSKDMTSKTITLNIPEKIKENTLDLTINVSPTIAGAIIEALPYLAEYPYGCTEQTLNRFVPTITVYSTMKKLGIDLTKLTENRKNNNLNSQELGDNKKRREQWKQQQVKNKYNPEKNPIYDADEIKVLSKKGIKRLLKFQNSNGGWGWFNTNTGGKPSAYLTALVLNGLYKANDCSDFKIPTTALTKGANWLYDDLKNEFYKRQNDIIKEKKKFPNTAKKTVTINTQDIFAMYILAKNGYFTNPKNIKSDKFIKEFLAITTHENNFKNYNLYSKILVALLLKETENIDCVYQVKYIQIMELIKKNLVIDDENQTAYLEDESFNYYWYWYNSDIETMSYYLKLLLRTASNTNDNMKVATKLVKFLVNNRKNSTYWNSTRDTAIAIDAICEYLTATNELSSEKLVKVYLDDKLIKTFNFTKDNLFTTNTRIKLTKEQLKKGSQPKVKITVESPNKNEKKTNLNVFFNAYLRYFSKEDFITASGLEIKVNRKYYRVEKAKDSSKETFTSLKTGDAINQGDEIKVVMIATAKNDYEYILFEDFKIAGLESINKNSGYQNIGFNYYVNSYIEYRFDRVCFFVERLPKGKSVRLTYRLRAETKGKFTALPAKAQAMYAPELRGNSNQFDMIINQEK